MDTLELKPIVEALIFVAEEPLSVGAITLILEDQGVTKKEVEESVNLLIETYNNNEHAGIQLIEVAGGYHFRTKPMMANWIQKLNVPKPIRLSQPAMETLAIVAYRQPIVRSEIEEIRGVDSGGVLKTLLERELIKIVGRRDEPGNPLVYGTTKDFLDLFSLKSLSELPPLKSYEELEQMRTGALPAQTGKVGFEGEIDVADIMDLPTPEEFSGRKEWEAEDHEVLEEIDSGVKRLRKLENVIFPKPAETFSTELNPEAAILAAAESLVKQGEGSATEELSHYESENQNISETGEDTTPLETRSHDEVIPADHSEAGEDTIPLDPPAEGNS